MWILIKMAVMWLGGKIIKNLIKKPATWVWMAKTIIPRLFKTKSKAPRSPNSPNDPNPPESPKNRKLGWRLRRLLGR